MSIDSWFFPIENGDFHSCVTVYQRDLPWADAGWCWLGNGPMWLKQCQFYHPVENRVFYHLWSYGDDLGDRKVIGKFVGPTWEPWEKHVFFFFCKNYRKDWPLKVVPLPGEWKSIELDGGHILSVHHNKRMCFCVDIPKKPSNLSPVKNHMLSQAFFCLKKIRLFQRLNMFENVVCPKSLCSRNLICSTKTVLFQWVRDQLIQHVPWQSTGFPHVSCPKKFRHSTHRPAASSVLVFPPKAPIKIQKTGEDPLKNHHMIPTWATMGDPHPSSRHQVTTMSLDSFTELLQHCGMLSETIHRVGWVVDGSSLKAKNHGKMVI